jgi:hypothetical protein
MSSKREQLSCRIRETISNLSDDDLIKILESPQSDYLPFAMEVAREEIIKRGGEELLRRRIAEELAQLATPQVEIPQRPTGLLQAIPRGSFGRDYELFEGDRTVAYIDVSTSWYGDSGEFLVGGETYKVYRLPNGEHSGNLVLEFKESILAQAEESVFIRSYEVEYSDQHYTLKAALPILRLRKFLLLKGNERIGTIFPDSTFTKKASIDLPPMIPLCIKTFIFWIVVHDWRNS